MSTLTLRIPDGKYERLKQFAQSRNISVNKLFNELATIALTQFDAKTRFELRAAKGDPQKGLEILDRIDRLFEEQKNSAIKPSERLCRVSRHPPA